MGEYDQEPGNLELVLIDVDGVQVITDASWRRARSSEDLAAWLGAFWTLAFPSLPENTLTPTSPVEHAAYDGASLHLLIERERLRVLCSTVIHRSVQTRAESIVTVRRTRTLLAKSQQLRAQYLSDLAAIAAGSSRPPRDARSEG